MLQLNLVQEFNLAKQAYDSQEFGFSVTTCLNILNGAKDQPFEGKIHPFLNQTAYLGGVALFEWLQTDPSKAPYNNLEAVVDHLVHSLKQREGFITKPEMPHLVDSLLVYTVQQSCSESILNTFSTLKDIGCTPVNALYLAGQLFRQQGEVANARQCFQDVIDYGPSKALDPVYHSARLGLCECLIQQGQMTEAVAMFDEAQPLWQGNCDPVYQLEVGISYINACLKQSEEGKALLFFNQMLTCAAKEQQALLKGQFPALLAMGQSVHQRHNPALSDRFTNLSFAWEGMRAPSPPPLPGRKSPCFEYRVMKRSPSV